METIGQILVAAREKKALSIEEAAKQTKIHNKVIESLEADRFEELPAPLYVKGFIRRYGRFLEVDAEELVKMYIGEDAERPKQVFVLDEVKLGLGKIGEYAGYLAIALIIGGGIIIFIKIGVFVLKTMNSDNASVATEAENNSPVEVPSAYRPSLVVDPSVEPEPAPTPIYIAPVETTASVTEKQTKAVRLKVKVKDDCWLRVKVDGEGDFVGILKKNTSRVWEAEEKIDIWTGKAEVMSLELNGRLLGAPGDGVIRDIVVTKEGLSR